MSVRYSFKAPVLSSIAILLSLRIINTLLFAAAILFKASNAIPPVREPSPIIAIVLIFSPCKPAAVAIPSAAEMLVDECPTPKLS